MSRIRRTRTVVTTREVVVVQPADQHPAGRCPLCGSELHGPVAPESRQLETPAGPSPAEAPPENEPS